MRTLLCLQLMMFAMMSTTSAQTTPTPQADAQGQAAIIASDVLKRLDAAWNQADGAKFAAEFSEDADVINIFGTHIRTRAEMAKRMQSIFNTIFKGSTHRARNLEIARYLAPDTIIVLSSTRVEVPTGPLAPEERNRQTFILVENGDAWQIRHWHNTSIRQQQ